MLLRQNCCQAGDRARERETARRRSTTRIGFHVQRSVNFRSKKDLGGWDLEKGLGKTIKRLLFGFLSPCPAVLSNQKKQE